MVLGGDSTVRLTSVKRAPHHPERIRGDGQGSVGRVLLLFALDKR